MTSSWYCINLGDDMWAEAVMDDIKTAFKSEYFTGQTENIGIFIRHKTVGV